MLLFQINWIIISYFFIISWTLEWLWIMTWFGCWIWYGWVLGIVWKLLFFWQFRKENFDSLKREILTVWKGKFWQIEKGNFDSLKREILIVWPKYKHLLWTLPNPKSKFLSPLKKFPQRLHQFMTSFEYF